MATLTFSSPLPIADVSQRSVAISPRQGRSVINAMLQADDQMVVFRKDRPVRGAKLPQDSTAEELRSRVKHLQGKQNRYIYKAPDRIPDIAFLSAVEGLEDEQPSRIWKFKFALTKLKARINFAIHDSHRLSTLLDTFRFLFSNTTNQFSLAHDAQQSQRVAESVRKKLQKRRSRVSKDFEETSLFLAEYRELFKTLGLPPIANVFMEDNVFCRLRVAGYNPMSLKAVTTENELPASVTDDHMLPGDCTRLAIAENRLYALDFSVLDTMRQESHTLKRFAHTKALFAVPPGATNGDLRVLAIEMNGELITPPSANDKQFPARWEIAKMAVNVSDTLHHQLIAHLCGTHLAVEPFVLATMRQLAPEHPVHMLLRPHFEGTAFINESAANTLVSAGGPVDNILAGNLDDGIKLVSAFMNDLDFNQSMPDVDLHRRGLMAENLSMPYRDDALLHWNALLAWVKSYLSLFYKSPLDISADPELTNWVNELVDKKQGRVCGFGDNGDNVVRSVDYLARAIANVIFLSAIQHAAVNFPQAITMLYPPAVAGFLQGNVPEHSVSADIDTWNRLLVPVEDAINQVQVFTLLGGVYHTTLGHYKRNALPNDKRVRDALAKYQKELKHIEKIIETRELRNVIKYDFLQPSKIPQSTNI